MIFVNYFDRKRVCSILFVGHVHFVYRIGPDMRWNNFDFWLVALCWLPASLLGGQVGFLRLLRLMRLLKLVSKVKQLQVIVMGLINGLSSVKYILLLMLLVFYMFAVLGVATFRRNNPFFFGSIGIAMVTLFRVATLDSWSAIMYTEWFGCDSQYAAVNGVRSTSSGPFSCTYIIYHFNIGTTLRLLSRCIKAKTVELRTIQGLWPHGTLKSQRSSATFMRTRAGNPADKRRLWRRITSFLLLSRHSVSSRFSSAPYAAA